MLRALRPDDAIGLFDRRNDPEVARYQSWPLPFPLARAQQMVTDIASVEGPASDEWWMLVVTDAETDETYGDLALLLGNEGRSAEIGFTLASAHWGNGYATEAVAAMVAHLFEGLQVTRVSAMLHPDNRSSAMVLERTGFVFEGHTRLSYWVGDEPSDDLIYGMIRPDWTAWRDRSRTAPAEVRLEELTDRISGDVLNLRTHKSQEAFVAPMSKSLAQVLTPPSHDGHPAVPWMRAIEADGEIVGFVLLALSNEHQPETFLWRLLIDRMHQRRGIAGRALGLVEDECRAMGSDALHTSWLEGRGSPRPFYLGRGFEVTGRTFGDEIEGRKALD